MNPIILTILQGVAASGEAQVCCVEPGPGRVGRVKGDEIRVADAFVTYLEGKGWTAEREVSWCDVVGRRGGEVLYAEAKGRTAAMGLDVDTLYGQLLRRMPNDRAADVRFAVVVPEEARAKATRVPERVRKLLNIDIYLVDQDGGVSIAS
ncbi:MAG: hypothetical protein WA880_03535 [Ornithinimicrobium sp.]